KACKLLASVGEDNGTRAVNHRTQTTRIKRRGHVGCSATLAAITRHEEPRVRHTRAELGELLWISRAHNRTGNAIAALAGRLARNLFDQVAHPRVTGRSTGLDVLQ